MGNFEEGHPCRGKNCLDCETCIFDEELFIDGDKPNKKKVNMCNNKTCNGCENLIRDYANCVNNRFDAACRAVTYTAFNVSRPRRIDYNLSPNQDVAVPTWCPLKSSNAMLPTPSQVTHKPNPQYTGPGVQTTPPPPPMTNVQNSYSDKRERMKGLRKHIEWLDIKEGHVYVIPKILNQSRKIVKVITKTDMSCICHEISEYTGNEYNYNSTFYPSDLDAVFITELHNF
jgi:hypothetical protein